MLIVVIGRAGSGKTTISKEVCKLTDLPLVEMSTIVQNLQQRSKEQRGQININKDQREKQNPDWLWCEVYQEIVKVGKGSDKSCIISGIREPYLLYKIRELKSDVFVIGLEVSLFNRYSRLCARDGFMGVKDFRSIDNGTKEKDGYVGDNELGLDITLTGCDVIVNANASLGQSVGQIERELFNKGIYSLIRRS